MWRYGLIAIGSASSLLYPHAPLVSYAEQQSARESAGRAMHGLTPDVLLQILGRGGIGAIALFALYTVLVQHYQRFLQRALLERSRLKSVYSGNSSSKYKQTNP